MSNISTKSIGFSSLGLANVLKRRLEIPPHQREYSWDTEQVNQLLDDITAAMAEDRDYFLGTIVTVSENGVEPLDVVDGQQRLTTMAITLGSIRNYLKKLDVGKSAIIVESLNNQFLSTIDREAGQRVPLLKLNIDDNDFFEHLMSSEPEDDSIDKLRQSHELLESAMMTAQKWIKTFVGRFQDSEKPDRLNDWINFVEDRAHVILMEATDASQAFKMFETLNDRGLRTSQADLVKSYLFSQSGARTTEAITKWSSMRENLEEIGDDDRVINFLRHTVIATKQFARADDVYSVTQTQIRGIANSISFLSDLERLSRIYVATFKADSEHWQGASDRLSKALRTFNMFDVKPIRPLLLTIALKFNGKNLEQAIELLMSISVRLVISSATRSGTNEQTFASAALSVFNGVTTNIKELKSAVSKVTISDSEFKESFIRAKSSKAELARYYLRALEAVRKNEPEPWFVPNENKDMITLEHILPKKPPAGSWLNFDEEQHATQHRRLGNLCLLQKSTNSNKNNDTFEAAKKIYSDSPYSLTSEIAKYDDWNIDNINDRQEKLAELAVKAWPI